LAVTVIRLPTAAVLPLNGDTENQFALDEMVHDRVPPSVLVIEKVALLELGPNKITVVETERTGVTDIVTAITLLMPPAVTVIFPV
jgi:hypothetical protein